MSLKVVWAQVCDCVRTWTCVCGLHCVCVCVCVCVRVCVCVCVLFLGQVETLSCWLAGGVNVLDILPGLVLYPTDNCHFMSHVMSLSLCLHWTFHTFIFTSSKNALEVDQMTQKGEERGAAVGESRNSSFRTTFPWPWWKTPCGQGKTWRRGLKELGKENRGEEKTPAPVT